MKIGSILENQKTEKRISITPEIAKKYTSLGFEIYEVPINYNGRNYKQGKKIKTIDAFRALKTLIKYR